MTKMQFTLAAAALLPAAATLAQVDPRFIDVPREGGPRVAVPSDPPVNPANTVLYDTLWITDTFAVNAGVGNAIGGSTPFPSLGTIDSQFADDFDLDATYQINVVIADFMLFYPADHPEEGFWIQFYADDGDKPSEDVYAEVVALDWDATYVGEFVGRDSFRYEMDISAAGIVLGPGRWWVDVQPLDIDKGGWYWANAALDITPPIGAHAHVRDGWLAHGNNYFGLWGSPTWIEHNLRGRGTPSMRLEGQEVGAGPSLTVSGTCPGSMTAEVSGATPRGPVVLGFAMRTGSVIIPSGPCRGTQLGLGPQGLQQVATLRADANGDVTFRGNAPGSACGGFVQAIDGATCETTNVEQVQ
jgi:hypothetical protein